MSALASLIGTTTASLLNRVRSDEDAPILWYFPWTDLLVRLPERDRYRSLRSTRNQLLINEEEQQRLLARTVAVCGLSVGSNVVEQLMRAGIGGRVILADPDTIDYSNLNRISATVADVGQSKVDWIAKRISLYDPYIEQHHIHGRVSAESLEGLLTSGWRPDILFDEMDDFSAKIALREFARRECIPVVMATDVGDSILLDVERHDTDRNQRIFCGRLHRSDRARLRDPDPMTYYETGRMMMRIVGIHHITTRLLYSGIDDNLMGLPQLGTTAAMASSLAVVAARELLLGRKLSSGRYSVRLSRVLDLSRRGSVGKFIAGLRVVRQRGKQARAVPVSASH